MPWFISESDEFILDTRAIPRADPFDFPAIHRGLVEIATNNIGRLGGGVGHPARNLFKSGLPAQSTFPGLFHVEQVLRIAGVVKGE